MESMKNLMGSEKQIKWAEDIRSCYVEKAKELKEIEEIVRNTEKVGKAYTHRIDRNQESVIEVVAEKVSGMGKNSMDKWIEKRYDELEGVPARIRIAKADLIKKIREELENKLDSEDSAQSWIDIRL